MLCLFCFKLLSTLSLICTGQTIPTAMNYEYIVLRLSGTTSVRLASVPVRWLDLQLGQPRLGGIGQMKEEKTIPAVERQSPSHQHLTRHLILLQSICPGGFKYKKTKKFCHSLEDGGVEAEKMGGRGGKGNWEGENKLKTVRVRGGAYCRRGEGKKAHKKRKKKRGEKDDNKWRYYVVPA